MANSSFNLSNLNGSNGFTINGLAANESSGRFVSSTGDINGDNGFTINGIAAYDKLGVCVSSAGDINGIAAFDESGFPVSSAGDINNDGIDDLIIGAFRADPNGSYSGQSYVVFGHAGIGASGTLELSQLAGSIDFNTTFTGTPVLIVDTRPEPSRS